MKRSLLDARVLVAWLVAEDENHSFAVEALQSARRRGRLTVSEFSVAEAYTHLRRLTPARDAEPALTLFEALRNLGADELAASPAVRERARAILARYRDQTFSYADAVLFATASEPGPWTVATTDARHFSAYRFPRSVRLIMPA